MAFLARIPDSGHGPPLITGVPSMKFDLDTKNEKVHRFEKALRELIDEGYSFVDHGAWFEAAAARASVDLQEVLSTWQ
jgi:hypothetical protein